MGEERTQWSSPHSSCGYSGPRMVWHPPRDRQQGSVRPCCSHPCQELPAAAASGAALHPTFHLSPLCLLKPERDVFTDQTPEERSCRHLHEHTAETRGFGGSEQGRGEVSRHGVGTAREGRNISNISHTHFFTSWAELFCSSSGCVARRGVLCPLHGYE